MRVQVAEHPQVKPPARVIIVHLNFLPDNSLFLCHHLLRKVRLLHKVEEDVEVLVQAARRRKEVASLGKTGKGVRVCPQLAEEVESVVVLLFKELMF